VSGGVEGGGDGGGGEGGGGDGGGEDGGGGDGGGDGDGGREGGGIGGKMKVGWLRPTALTSTPRVLARERVSASMSKSSSSTGPRRASVTLRA